LGHSVRPPTVILNDTNVRDNNDPLIAPTKKPLRRFFFLLALSLLSFTPNEKKSAIMADGDEEIAALVIDNGSGMCKGMFPAVAVVFEWNGTML
jgi:hypothetical protein